MPNPPTLVDPGAAARTIPAVSSPLLCVYSLVSRQPAAGGRVREPSRTCCSHAERRAVGKSRYAWPWGTSRGRIVAVRSCSLLLARMGTAFAWWVRSPAGTAACSGTPPSSSTSHSDGCSWPSPCRSERPFLGSSPALLRAPSVLFLNSEIQSGGCREPVLSCYVVSDCALPRQHRSLRAHVAQYVDAGFNVTAWRSSASTRRLPATPAIFFFFGTGAPCQRASESCLGRAWSSSTWCCYLARSREQADIGSSGAVADCQHQRARVELLPGDGAPLVLGLYFTEQAQNARCGGRQSGVRAGIIDDEIGRETHRHPWLLVPRGHRSGLWSCAALRSPPSTALA